MAKQLTLGDLQKGVSTTPSSKPKQLTLGDLSRPKQEPIITQPTSRTGFSFAPMPDYTKEQQKANTKLQQEAQKLSSSTINRGGAGLQGAFGEVKQMGRSVEEKAVKPIQTAPLAYRHGDLQKNLSLEYYKKAQGEKNDVEKISKQIVEFENKYPEITKSKNIITQTITSAPSSVESQIEGIKQGGVLSVGGALIGAGLTGLATGGAGTGAGAIGGAKLAGGAGYVKGTAESTYKMEYGSAYQTMIEMGVPEDIAKKEAKNVGLINAGIEGGESIIDLVTMGQFSKLTGAVKSSLVKKYGGEMVESWLKKAGKSYLANIPTEAIEETLQEKSTIEGEKRATQQAGIKRDSSQDAARLQQSAILGGAGALLLGGATNVLGSSINTGLNKIGTKPEAPTQTQLEAPTTTIPQTNINTPTTTQTTLTSQINPVIERNVVELTPQDTNVVNFIDKVNTILPDNAKVELAIVNMDNLKQELNIPQGTNLPGLIINNKIYLDEKTPNKHIETAKHEFSHFVENSDEYDGFSDFILTELDKKGQLQQAIEDIRSIYEPIYTQQGRTLQENDIYKEIVANFSVDNILSNETFINRLANDNRNMAQKFYDYIKERVKALSNVATMTKEEREILAFYKKAEKLYEKALKGKFETTSTQQLSVEGDFIVKNSKGEVVSNYDSTGKKLPKEVVKFFKDSKVRDEKGNLLVVYHGTSEPIYNFKDGSVFFTNYKKGASQYAKQWAENGGKGTLIKSYLNLRNPLIIDAEGRNYNEIIENYTDEKTGKFYRQLSTNAIIPIAKRDGYDGVIINDVFDFEDDAANDYIVFNSNQIKETTNLKPTSNEDIRLKAEVTKEETKTRGFEKTIKSSTLLSKKTKKLIEETDYVVQGDKDAIKKGKSTLKQVGYDNLLNSIETKFELGERFTKQDIVNTELLIREAQAKGDLDKVTNLISQVSIMATELGQSIQALSLVNKLSPRGRLQTLTNIIYRENKNIEKRYKDKKPKIKLSKEVKDSILNAKTTEELDLAVANAIQEISQQMPLSFADKARSWRYLAMLGNPKTHIKNLVANAIFTPVRAQKNFTAKVIETIVNPAERTKTLKKATPEQKTFAKLDVKEVAERLSGDKYDTKSLINKNKRAFDGKILNFLAELNGKSLEWGDKIFSNGVYERTLANYMAANNLTPDYLNSGTTQANVALEKARSYAVSQALEATFKQFNALANYISSTERNANPIVREAISGVVPYKKTPANILTTGLEYSPLGLVKTLMRDSIKLKNNEITATKYIDNLSKGLTGTSATALGMLLSALGILTASGPEDDKEKKFGELQGNQRYSLNIGGKSYSLDWVAPIGIPIFLGVEIQKAMEEDKEINGWQLLDSASKMLDPLTEMSLLQGINTTLSSYEDNKIEGLIANTSFNYAGQYVPTLMGQFARTIDTTRRSTMADENKDTPKNVQMFLNKQIAKVPFASKTLPAYIDAYGREQKSDTLTAALQNFISPSYIKDINETKVDRELAKLFEITKNTKILPSVSSTFFSNDKEEINLTPKQYEKFAKIDGQSNYDALEALFKSSYYKSLPDTTTDEDEMSKEKAIEKIYRYSQNKAKVSFIKDKEEKEKLQRSIDKSEYKFAQLFNFKK